MVENEPDTWALESAPPTAAEATEEGAAMRLSHESPGLTMRVWELAGGVPGPDGWVRARSRAGDYHIEVPGSYADISHYYADASIRFANHHVRATVHEISYNAGREHVYGGAPFPGFNGEPVRDPLARMRRGWAGNPNTMSLRDVACAGVAGFEAQSRGSKGTWGVLRAFDAGAKGTYVLSVEGPGEQMTKHRRDIDRFFDSFAPAGSVA